MTIFNSPMRITVTSSVWIDRLKMAFWGTQKDILIHVNESCGGSSGLNLHSGCDIDSVYISRSFCRWYCGCGLLALS